MEFIKFGSEFQCSQYLAAGWSRPEVGIVWSNDTAATLKLARGNLSGDCLLRIAVKVYLPSCQPLQPVTVNVNEVVITDCVLQKPDDEIEIFLPAGALLKQDAVVIKFHFHAPLRPSDVSASQDTRLLSIALVELAISELNETRRAIDCVDNMLFCDAHVGQSLRAEREADARLVNKCFNAIGPGLTGLSMLLESYVRGAGAVIQVRRRYREEIERRLELAEAGGSAYVFDARGQINVGIVQKYAPPFDRFIFQPAPDDWLKREEILQSIANELYDPDPKLPFFSHARKKVRPGVDLISMQDADVYVHPYHCVVHGRDEGQPCAGLNAQDISRLAFGKAYVDCPHPVVILQDKFDGGNLSHFLFDSVTRMYHFCSARPDIARDARFIFGGWPGPFHRHVLSRAARELGLAERQFIFPRQGYLLRPRAPVFWLSDQLAYLHPGQLMHPESVNFLRGLGAHVVSNAAHSGRIYITRADAPSRRLANEAELLAELRGLDFRVARLADMPAQAQIDLIANASCVVAPHGMGLTHLAFHQGRPAVIEMFNPELGSEAYALLARAYKFNYHAIAGEEVDPLKRHFRVDVAEVIAAVTAALASQKVT